MGRAVRARPGATVWLLVVALLGIVAWAAPSASGAYLARITNSTDTAATAPYFQCSAALAQDSSSALFQWPLSDAPGSTTVSDISGSSHPGIYQGTTTTDSTAPLACPRDASHDGGTSWSLDGSTESAYYGVKQTNPQIFTIEVWFRTTSPQGKLIDYAATQAGGGAQYDRQLYVDRNGRVEFGIYSGATHTVIAPAVVTDGAWHQAAATLSSAGMALYLDGRLVASDSTQTAAEAFNGYWRVGYDNINGAWPNYPVSGYFKGRLRYAAVYTTALTATQIANHWGAGSGT